MSNLEYISIGNISPPINYSRFSPTKWPTIHKLDKGFNELLNTLIIIINQTGKNTCTVYIKAGSQASFYVWSPGKIGKKCLLKKTKFEYNTSSH